MTQNDTFYSSNDSPRQPTETELKTEAAQYYHTFGVSVLPTQISWDDKKRRYDKKFLCSSWSQWQTRVQTEAEFQSLNWIGANGLTVILGPQAKNGLYLTVIDYDVKGEASEEAKQKGLNVLAEFPKTRMEQTVNHGLHLFFWSKTSAKNVSLYHGQSGVELLGCPHLCVIAPSHGYTPLNDCNITKVDDIEQLFKEIMKTYDVADKESIVVTPAPAQISKTVATNATFNGQSNAIRPCIQSALSQQLEHSNGHQMRLCIAAELKKYGWTDQETARLFENQKDYNYNFTLRQVKSADPNYAASCKTIQDLGYCLKDACSLYKKQQHEECEEPIELACLNDVENPIYAGQHVKVTAIVSSTSVAYQIPAEITADIPLKDENQKTLGFETVSIKIKKTNPINLSLIDIQTATRDKTLKQLFNNKQASNITVDKYRTEIYLRIRPPIHTIQQQNDGKLVDEHGKEYKHYDIHIVTDTPLSFQSSTKIALTGIPLPNPKNQRTTLLVYKIDFLDEKETFDITKINRLYNKLASLNSVQERLDWIIENTGRYTQIIGRQNVATAALLAYFTPLTVTLNNDVQRGWGLVDIIGDSTTGKSETVKKIARLLNAGMVISAETASMPGITAATSRLDNGVWFVDWGFLPHMDCKLLAMDGCHKIPSWDWAQTAETEREGQLNITKAGKASHPARTRQIKIYNAVDKEAKGWPTKQLSEFLHPIQAYPSVADPTIIARRDLVVFVNSKDVTATQINQNHTISPEPEYVFLGEVLKWCWSGKVGVVFAEEASVFLRDKATELHNVFHYASIPVVSADMRFKLARLSTALAFLTLSVRDVEDYSRVIVSREHVEVVVNFLTEEYTRAGLGVLAQASGFEVLSVEDVGVLFARIEAKLVDVIDREVLCEILKKIVFKGVVTADVLKSAFNLTENGQRRPLLAVLQELDLVKRVSNGFCPLPKLIEAYRVSEGFTVFNQSNVSNQSNQSVTDVSSSLLVSHRQNVVEAMGRVPKKLGLDVEVPKCGGDQRGLQETCLFDSYSQLVCVCCKKPVNEDWIRDDSTQNKPVCNTCYSAGCHLQNENKHVIRYKLVPLGESVALCPLCNNYDVQYVLTGVEDKGVERCCGVCLKQRIGSQSNIRWIRDEEQVGEAERDVVGNVEGDSVG